jgi:hypothetical protein
MQVDPPRRLCRLDHAQRDLVAVLAGDRHRSRPVRKHRSRKGALPAAPGGAHHLGADDPPLRLPGQHFDHLRIQFRGLGIDRFLAKQSGIERARIGHGILPPPIVCHRSPGEDKNGGGDLVFVKSVCWSSSAARDGSAAFRAWRRARRSLRCGRRERRREIGRDRRRAPHRYSRSRLQCADL